MVDFDTISDSLGALGQGVGKLLRAIFGSQNARRLKRMLPTVEAVNAKAEWAAGLSEADMKAQTAAWREEVAAGRKLDELVPEAFAMVREAADRTLGLRHFDVQIIGGLVLHQGAIAEMATGEGKTLVATLPAYLNALAGSVYVVTVNDYLARRDAAWMKPVYDYLGVSVGAIQSSMSPAERHPVYACDIVYGTNNEFGFDYLRDNMKSRTEDQVQKRLDYAIIDEVDSILIDEARTPLIISGPATGGAEKYWTGIQAARKLEPEKHFELKEKEKQAILTEEGIVRAQQLLGVEDFYSSPEHMEWPHIIETCLRALHLYALDVDYVVKDTDRGKEIVIVDEFTGRLMEGRRWSDGLHQACEAKEGLRPREQNQTLATITFQNYFRLFRKLAGMTGTAMTEAAEFASIYDLDVVQIPTNKPVIRRDEKDVIYLRKEDKWKAIAKEIEEVSATGQPILVGTISIESSELLSGMLKRRGVKHEVLNAKHHEREAEIVAQAGRKGAVTVATNMAGRGTDIVLGGNPEGLYRRELARLALAGEELDEEAKRELRERIERQCEEEKQEVLAAGGLYVLGTERHEARRIDNQLRGRSGRQGDPGRSRFFLSLDDDLMRRFYRDWVKNFLARAGMGGGEPVESAMVSRAIEKAQKKVETYHFEIRKNLLEYDEVMDKQRHLIYQHRQEALEARDLRERVLAMFEEVIQATVATYEGDGRDVPPDYEAIALWAQRKWGCERTAAELEEIGIGRVAEVLLEDVRERLARRDQELGEEAMRELERFLLLNAIDSKWKDHLFNMDALRQGIGLRGYAQVDPKTEYKREGLAQFEDMLFRIADEVTDYVLRVQLAQGAEERLERAYSGARASHPAPASLAGSVSTGPMAQRPQRRVAVGYQAPAQADPLQQYARQQAEREAASNPTAAGGPTTTQPKVPRNAPCPCGSGRKYKQCHGRAG
ncbi:MAG: preprotein translocase subunit SecA [Planctomycetota bacterium]|nr:MAG: preprotein translocase subunit SecA [Planctomycetota bacterium]